MNRTQTFIAETLSRAERFIQLSNIAESTFGMRAVGDATVVQRLRHGKITLRTVERIDEYISNNTDNGTVAQ